MRMQAQKTNQLPLTDRVGLLIDLQRGRAAMDVYQGKVTTEAQFSGHFTLAVPHHHTGSRRRRFERTVLRRELMGAGKSDHGIALNNIECIF